MTTRYVAHDTGLFNQSASADPISTVTSSAEWNDTNFFKPKHLKTFRSLASIYLVIVLLLEIFWKYGFYKYGLRFKYLSNQTTIITILYFTLGSYGLT